MIRCWCSFVIGVCVFLYRCWLICCIWLMLVVVYVFWWCRLGWLSCWMFVLCRCGCSCVMVVICGFSLRLMVWWLFCCMNMVYCVRW